MNRIAFVTDNHWDIHSRFEECKEIHEWIRADAGARGCQMTLLGGDMFERRSCPEERNAVAEWLVWMAQLGPVYGVAGNHDALGEFEVLNQLEAAHRILIENRPRVIASDDGQSPHIALIPWPRKGALLAEAEGGSEGASNDGIEALRNVLRGMSMQLDECRRDLARVAVGHIMIDGARTDHDQPLVGVDMALSLADMALLRADAYALGHIHAQNDWEIDGSPVFYGGAPRHCNFGEPGPKGYCILHIDGRSVRVERIATPCTPMVHVSAVWGGSFQVMTIGDHAPIEGAEVRLRYHTAPEHREAAKTAAQAVATGWEAAGAVSVKVEEQVTATARARAPEVAMAPTVPEKLRALWANQGRAPDRADQLIAMSVALEEEVRHAS